MNAGFDPEALLRLFAATGREYVVIGGVALNAHGVIRATKDLDICPASDRANLERLASILRALEAEHLGLDEFAADVVPFDPTSVDDLQQGGDFRLATRLGVLDVMQWIAGVPGDVAYPVLAADALLVELPGVSVPVCSLARQRDMKRAAGRPQELQDLADLAIAHPEDAA